MIPGASTQSLFDHLHSGAARILARQRRFYPFAATLDADGTIHDVHEEDGIDLPPPEDAIAALVERLGQLAAGGSIRAAGLCVDDAGGHGSAHSVTILLEQPGVAHAVTVPYTRRPFRAPEFGERRVSPIAPRIFAAKPGREG